MTSFSIFDNTKKSNSFSSSTKVCDISHNNDLIGRIPKLNLQNILNKEKNITIIPISRNANKSIDKQQFISTNHMDKSNINIDNDDERKYETDNNIPIKCHNNIFDFYDIDKYDTNNSTSFESKNISSNSYLNSNKKYMINKTVRKKRIINLKSFLYDRKIKSNKNNSLDKFFSILRKVLLNKIFKKLVKYNNNTSSRIDEIKFKNFKEKIDKSNNRDNNIPEINDIIVNTQVKLVDNNNECYNCNNLSDTNSCNNYFYYIEQLSSRYNREREENIFNMFKYRPTNISFVVNNFSNNTIFNNVDKQFKLINDQSKINYNVQSQINLYKKYYGDIEAINEEDNESEEIKNRKSSRRNQDGSLNDPLSLDDNIDFSMKKMLYNIKVFNNKIPNKNNKLRIYKVNEPIYDNKKINIEMSMDNINKITEIDKIKRKNDEVKSKINKSFNNFNKHNSYKKGIINNDIFSANPNKLNLLNKSKLVSSDDEKKKSKKIKKLNSKEKEKDNATKFIFNEIIPTKLISFALFFVFIIMPSLILRIGISRAVWIVGSARIIGQGAGRDVDNAVGWKAAKRICVCYGRRRGWLEDKRPARRKVL